MDGAGHFSAAEWVEAGSDEAALEAARQACKALGCELWQGNRLIGRISGSKAETPDD